MVTLHTSVPESSVYNTEQQLRAALTRMVINSESIEANSARDVVVRGILPADDLDSGDENGWTSADEEWRQDWSASGTADAYNEAYEIDSASLADDKIIAFYGVILDSNPVTRQIRFGQGTTGNQGTKAWVNVEAAEHDDEGTGIFSEAIVYGPTENGNIEHWIDATTDGHRLIYKGFVAEAVGETLSQASNPQV